MLLKFIGKDGSIGFKHGQQYDINITNSDKHIIVLYSPKGLSIPYSTPKSFAANWQKVSL